MTAKTFEDLVRENPDKFDAMDCRPGPSSLDPDYSDSLIPEHMRARVMSARSKKRERERLDRR